MTGKIDSEGGDVDMKGSLFAVALVASLSIVGPAQAAGDVQAGKAKSANCANCHGANGEGKSGAPALAGTAEPAFVQAMKDYKSGKRNNAVMKTFANPLSDDDIANLAAYYASLKKK
jgi:cytochrome c553